MQKSLPIIYYLSIFLSYFLRWIKAALFLGLTLIIANNTTAQGYIDCATMLNDSEGFSNGEAEAKVVNGYTYLMVSPYYDLTTDARFPIVNGEPSIIEDFSSEIYFAIFDPNCNQIKGTYIGGVGDFGSVYGVDLMVDAAGNAHIVGAMYSVTSIPTTDGTTIVDGADPYILHKYAPDGTLLFSTVYGGTTGSVRSGIVSSDGTNTYVTGYINGAIGFPTTDGTTTTGNLNEQYLTKYDGAGNLVYATLIGGTSYEIPFAITISNGCAIVVGSTSSTDFPTTDGTTNMEGIDIYITKYDPTGNLVFSTISGGSGTDIFNENTFIETDDTHIYVTGKTVSADFPTTDGTTLSGSLDVYVQKYDMAGNLIFSTLFGGIGHDSPSDLVLQGGELYLSGSYNTGDFPVTVGDISSTAGGNFLVKMDSDGNIIYARTYGTDFNGPNGIFVDPSGSVIMPIVASTDGVSFDNEKDSEGLYVAKINPDGTLCSSTFVNKSTGDNDLTCPEMIGDTLYLVSSTSDAGEGNTTDGTKYTDNEDFLITKFVFCPAPSPIIVDTLSTALITVCKNGIIDKIEGMEHTIDGSQFPQIFDDGVATTQSDIPLDYQWQVSPTGSDPWTDIPGPLAQQLGYTPAPTTTDLYYRRQTKTSECCGGAIISTSNIVHVQVTTDVAPMIEAGDTEYTCSGNPLMMDATVLGGAAPYIYNWNDGAYNVEDPTVSITQSTVFTLEVTDANGCMQVDQTTVTVYEADAGIDSDVCDGVGATIGGDPLAGVTIVPSGSTPPSGTYSIEYAWSPSAGLSCTDCPNPTATPSSITNYTLSVTLNKPNGSSCSSSDGVTIGVISAPSSSIAVSDIVICLGEELELGTNLPPLNNSIINSVQDESGNTYPAADFTDGDNSTGAFLPSGTTRYLTIDLGQTEKLNRIKASSMNGAYLTDYRFSCSTDGLNFIPIDSTSSFGTNSIDEHFSTFNARFIRIESTRDTFYLSLSEFSASYDYRYIWTPGLYIKTDGASTLFDAGNLAMPTFNPITYTVTANLETCNFYDQVTVAVIEAKAGKDRCGPLVLGDSDRTPDIEETYSWSKISDPTITTGSGNLTSGTNILHTTASASVGGDVGYELTVSHTLNGYTRTCKDTIIVVSDCGSSCGIKSLDGSCPSFDLDSPGLIAVPSDGVSTNWSYSWTSNMGMVGLDSYTSSQVNLTDNVTRTYTVTFTNLLNPSITCSATINANSAAYSTLNVIVDNVVKTCKGVAVNIGDPAHNPGLTYSWTNSQKLDNPNSSYPLATVDGTTNFFLTVKDNVTGCKVTEQIKIQTADAANAGPDIVVCDNSTVTIGANTDESGYNYSWSPAGANWQNGSNQNDMRPEVFIATSQQFILTATDIAGVCTTKDTMNTIVESLPPNFSLPNINYCPSQAGSLVLGNSNGTSSGTNYIPNGYTYSWVGLNVSDISARNPTVTPLQTTPTTYEINVIAPLGCTQKVTQTIAPTITAPLVASNQVICVGEPIAIGSNANPTSGISYSWSPSTGLSNAFSPNPTFTPSTVGTTIFTLTKSNGSCTTTAEVTITVDQVIVPSLSPQTICNGSTLQIGGSPVSGMSYDWSPSTGLNNPYISNPIFSGITSTNYTLTVINSLGCSAKVTTSVTVNSASSVTVNANDITTCAPSFVIDATVSPAGNYNYQWTPSTYLSNPNELNPTFYTPAVGTYQYALQVIDQATGCSSNETIDIEIRNDCSEICGNGIDDDGDGLDDCLDPDCSDLVFNIGNDSTICMGDNIDISAAVVVCNNSNCTGTTVSSYPYTNSFDNTTGDWTQDTDDDFNWIFEVDGTPSGNTGPSLPTDGSHYIFTESSNPNYPTKVGRITSPCFDLSTEGGATLAFDYHMFGSTMGTLDLQISTDNKLTWSSLWSLSGDQGNQWSTQQVDLSNYVGGNISLRFEGTTSTSYTSDMAIDRLSLTTTPFTYLWESGETTASITKTPASNTTYRVTVTGGTNTYTGEVMVTVNDCNEICNDGIDNDGDGQIDCADGDCGTPTITSVVPTNPSNCPSLDNGTIVINATGSNLQYSINNGAIYQTSNTFAGLSSNGYTIRVRNSVTGCSVANSSTITLSDSGCPEICDDGIDNDGDGQVDCDDGDCSSHPSCVGPNCTLEVSDNETICSGVDVILTATMNCNSSVCSGTSVSSYPYTNSFDNTTGDWTQDTDDDFNWIFEVDGTPSGNTGPSLPTDGSHYIFTESSHPNYPTKVGRITSPCFDLSTEGGATLAFDYHMFGSTMGTLDLQISTDNKVTWSSLWSLSGDQGNQWSTQQVDLSNYVGGNISLRFEATTSTSYTSDIAIDRFSLTTTPFTYLWESGETTASITKTPASNTTYRVTVTGGTNTYTGEVMVTVNDCNEICNDGIDNDGDGQIDCADGDCGTPTITSVVPTNPSNCPSLDNGSIVINATGSNLQYSINNGTSYQISNTFAGLSSNGYTIRVRNSVTGCSVENSSTITLSDPGCPEICDDGIDNDGDGQVDCDDPDCVVSSEGSIVGNEEGCGAYNPSEIVNTGDAVGYGNIQYQWQSSIDGIMWSDFPSGTLLTFDPPTIAQTTYYRRGARNEFCATWRYSNVVNKIVVNNYSNAGQITGGESNCDSYDPSLITSIAAPSGGSGSTPTYQWQSKIAGGNWTNISGATLSTYDPTLINETHEYRRGVRISPCTNLIFSNIVVMEVLGGSPANIATFPTGNLCSNTDYGFAAQDAGAGVIYSWNFGAYASSSSATGIGPHQISFDVPRTSASTTIEVELIVDTGTCDSRDTIEVVVLAGIDTTSIIKTDPTSCDVPNGSITINADYYSGNNIEVSLDGGASWKSRNNLTFNGLRAGPYDIQIRYRGQTCVYDFGRVILSDVTVVSSGILENYDLECDDLTHSFSATADATIDTYNWNFGSGASPATATGEGPHNITYATYGSKTVSLTIYQNGCNTVYSEPFELIQNVTDAGEIAEDQFLCNSNDPDELLNISNATGGTGGTITYQWQQRTKSTPAIWGNWNNILSETGLSYDPPVLSEETQYRRMASRTSCDGVPTNVVSITPSSKPDANSNNFASVCPGQAYSNDVSNNDNNVLNPSYTIYTAAQNGIVNIFDDGSFIYEPNSLFCGTDKFVYEVCNDAGTCCDTATVNLDLTDTAAPILFDIPEDISLHCDEDVPTPPFVLALENCLQVELGMDEVSTQGLSSCELHTYDITRVWTATDYCGLSANDSQTITVEDITAPGIYRIYTLANGTKMIGGFVDHVGERWKHVTLPITFATKPVIFTQVITENDASATSVQLKNVSKSQFSIRLMDEEANDAVVHGRERIAWIAMEQGTGTLNNPFQVSELSGESSAKVINFNQAFTNSPVMIAKTQTAYSSEPVEVRIPNLNSSNASVYLQEDQSADLETTHSIEGVGYVAFDKQGNLELPSGEIFGETGKTSLAGGTWTQIPLSHRYKNPIVVATITSENDNKPVAVRIKDVTPTSFNMKIDGWNYQTNTHGTEEVSYVIIEGSLPFDQTVACDAIPAPLQIGTEIITVDNCDVAVNIEYTEALNTNNCAPGNIITRSWYSEDECGNSVSYSRQISVFDNVDPEFTVPADVTIQCEDDINDLGLTGDVEDESDNCATGIEATYVDSYNGSFECDSSFTVVREWTLHDNCGNSVTKNQNINVIHRGVKIAIKMMLQGALLDASDDLMRDDLRNLGFLPYTEPYTEIASYQHIGGGDETADPAVFNVTGSNAIVDWVFVEIRNAVKHDSVIATRSALLQRDGDIVDIDGFSPVNFNNVQPGQYNFSVRHRNHLGALTLYPKRLKNEEQVAPFDFSQSVVLDSTNLFNAYDFDGDNLVYICQKTNNVQTTVLESFDNLVSYGTQDSLMTCGPCGTFKTVKDGNWMDPLIWENSNIPSIPLVGTEVVINHTVQVANDLEVGLNALLWVEEGGLIIDGKFNIQDNGTVYVLDSDVTLGGQMKLVSTPTYTPKLVMFGGQLNIGKDYDNNGADVVLRNVCLKAQTGFKSSGAVEDLTEVQVELLTGDFRIFATNSRLTANQSRFKLHAGSFVNAGQFKGSDNVLWVLDGGVQNNGAWESEISYYCMSGTTNLLNGELPPNQDCVNIYSHFSEFICENVVDKLIIDNIISNPQLPQIGSWGTDAQQVTPKGNALWAGDYNSDRRSIYQGPSNDISDLFVKVITDPNNINSLPNFIKKAYDSADIDLNGDVIYQGPNNERAKLLFRTILVSPGNNQYLPNYIISEQIPR